MPTTTHYDLELPTVGGDADTWGDDLNANFEAIGNAIYDLATGDTFLKTSENLGDLANVATARENLELEPGVDVLAYSTKLKNLADLELLAGRVLCTTGPTSFTAKVLTDKAAELLECSTVPLMQALLEVEPGHDVQEHSPGLDSLAALTPSEGDFIRRGPSGWVVRTTANVKSDLAISAAGIGLGNVDNTADTSKPVSSAQAAAIAAAVSAHAGESDPHAGYLTESAAASGYQPKDSDLTDIAVLAPADDAVMQRKSGHWTARTPSQLKADLALDQVSNLSAAAIVDTLTLADITDLVGKTIARVNAGTAPNSGLISWGTGDAPSLALGEIYLKHEA